MQSRFLVDVPDLDSISAARGVQITIPGCPIHARESEKSVGLAPYGIIFERACSLPNVLAGCIVSGQPAFLFSAPAINKIILDPRRKQTFRAREDFDRGDYNPADRLSLSYWLRKYPIGLEDDITSI